MAIFMGVFPTLFLKPMEPSVKRVVERVQTTQNLRVRNEHGAVMQDAKFKVQTPFASQQQSDASDALHTSVR
jgi:hypothetical protein